jgi:hypothetical protein
MVKLNPTLADSDGEFAVWIDGVKVGHWGKGFPLGAWSGGNFEVGGGATPFEGFQWRDTVDLTLSYLWLQHYMPTDPGSQVYFDDLVLATEYIGPLAVSGDTLAPAAPTNLQVVSP